MPPCAAPRAARARETGTAGQGIFAGRTRRSTAQLARGSSSSLSSRQLGWLFRTLPLRPRGRAWMPAAAQRASLPAVLGSAAFSAALAFLRRARRGQE